MVDFSKLKNTKQTSTPTDPIELFETLPNLPHTPNDLWRGQAAALTQWDDHRAETDVLVSLNTGAGKTLVGLLISKSLVNEGFERVIYACASIDLVRQTSREASNIGIDHTTRIGGQFDNDLFESGQSFCITTYHALFNGLSAFQRRYFPDAVIFDDAHVAESILRSCMTLRIESVENEDLFFEICELFHPHFESLDLSMPFQHAITGEQDSMVMVAPTEMRSRSNRLEEILRKHEASNDDTLKFAYAHLADKLNNCALAFGNKALEIAPPFLPSLALEYFSANVKRIYLSATLRHKTDLVRAFGRTPSYSIEPTNDAGNGERLFIFGREIEGNVSTALVEKILDRKKIVIAVPNYAEAENWEDIAIPPSRNSFSDHLQEFRGAKSGSFVLVSRVDGIDLPHDTCRVMVVDGLPTGSHLLERFQSDFLRMKNLQAAKISNRLVQLFGRINRGRNDYGVFLIAGRDLNSWMRNNRNIARFPKLLRRQVLMGRNILENLDATNHEGIIKLIEGVLNRNEDWLSYYQEQAQSDDLDVGVIQRTDEIEHGQLDAALAEANYAEAIWSGNLPVARQKIKASADAVTATDPLLAGWHYLWAGDALFAEGDLTAASIAFNNARARLNRAIALPRLTIPGQPDEPDFNYFGKKLFDLVALDDETLFEDEIASIRHTLNGISSGDTNQNEEGMRLLGDLLGFSSTRPDNDTGSGPDVLWADETTTKLIPIELKTGKDSPACYFKKDIGQAHNHIAWVAQEYPDFDNLGLVIVGPDGSIARNANPTDIMWQSDRSLFQDLSNQVLALISDLRSAIPLERRGRIKDESHREIWGVEALFSRLAANRLCALAVVDR